MMTSPVHFQEHKNKSPNNIGKRRHLTRPIAYCSVLHHEHIDIVNIVMNYAPCKHHTMTKNTWLPIPVLDTGCLLLINVRVVKARDAALKGRTEAGDHHGSRHQSHPGVPSLCRATHGTLGERNHLSYGTLVQKHTTRRSSLRVQYQL